MPARPGEETADGVAGEGDDEAGEDHHAIDEREHVDVDVDAGLLRDQQIANVYVCSEVPNMLKFKILICNFAAESHSR